MRRRVTSQDSPVSGQPASATARSRRSCSIPSCRGRNCRPNEDRYEDRSLFIGSHQALTNRTGHPVISVPNGFSRGSPTALHLTGRLFGEEQILLLAHAFQAKTDFHLQHPSL